RSPEPGHERREAGEARRDHADIVDGDRIGGAKPKGEERHGDAVIHMGRDETAALTSLPPSTVRSSPSTCATTPQAARPAAVALKRSLSFSLSSARPCMRVSPSAKAATQARTG